MPSERLSWALPLRSPVRIAALLLVLFAAGCMHREPALGAQATQTFVLVRHAEKQADAGGDPDLTTAGAQRASALAESLRDQPLRAAYATAYRRTQQTAAPAAALHHLQVTSYDANEPAPAMAARLLARHREGVVLVVGHSNTVADIAAALCGCAIPPLRDDEYDRLIRIRVHADGSARGKTTLEQERY